MCNAQHTKTVNDTPTPRTDAVASFGCVRDDFARQLEHELAEAQSQISTLQQHLATGRAWNAPDSLLAENAELREQLETEQIRLAACGIVATADTETSREHARDMLAKYRSGSLESVERRVDECIRAEIKS
jgi:regulator of replication initiation timing